MTEDTKEGIFNQAYYQQKRINDLLSRIDMLSINPLGFNPVVNTYNYLIIRADLVSCFMTASALFTEEEKSDMLKIDATMDFLLFNHPIHTKVDKGILLNKTSWDRFNLLLKKFRLELEKLMHIHGLGNPVKDDPRRSILKNE